EKNLVSPARAHLSIRDLNLNLEPLSESAARGGKMARNLRVHAHVVERSGRDRGYDRATVGAGLRRRAVISSLAGRNCSDDQPYQHDEPSESHFYLPKTCSSCSSEELRTRDVSTSTPCAADTHERRIVCPARAVRFTRRCIVSADGPGRQDRAARNLRDKKRSPVSRFPGQTATTGCPHRTIPCHIRTPLT